LSICEKSSVLREAKTYRNVRENLASRNATLSWARNAHASVFNSTRRQFATALASSEDGTAAQAMYRAMLMVFEGDVDEAVRRLRLALQRELALEERAYVTDLLIDALIESGRLDEARSVIEVAPKLEETAALLAAHRARVGARDSRVRRDMATQHALRYAVAAPDAERSAAVVLYRLADAAVRSGDYARAETYMSAVISRQHRSENARLRALCFDLRAVIKYREGNYDSAITFAQEALAIATALEERSLMARHAARSMRAAAEAGILSQYARDRRVLVQLGALETIDAVRTARADALLDLCLRRFQDAAAHLAAIDATGVPAEIQRELEGYRALAALGRRDVNAARLHASNAVAALPGGRRATANRTALRRARLLAGFVMHTLGSKSKAERLLRGTDLMESPDGIIALAVLNGKLAGVARRSGAARAMYATSRNAGAFLGLPPRQLEIARLLAGGRRPVQIAADLDIGLTTVKTQLQRLYRRLNVRKRADALRILTGGQNMARLP
jgi:DNA-binding CsgD family transcriptional regulator/tetratricopeptide (TPR) repeat protein